MKFIIGQLIVGLALGALFLGTGAMRNYAQYENLRAKAILDRQWQDAVVEQCKPRPAVKWSERAIDASINGIKVPLTHQTLAP